VRGDLNLMRNVPSWGVRFAFCTGADTSTFPEDFRDATVIGKPFSVEQVQQVVRSQLGR